MYKLSLPIAGLAVVLLAGNAAFPADEKSGSSKHAAVFDQCAKACSDCQRACDACAAHCAHLLAEGKKDHLRTLQTCQDCATHCVAAACIMSRHGPFADLICKACADACARCGKECDRLSNDPMMKKCADECKSCEKACREMLMHVEANR